MARIDEHRPRGGDLPRGQTFRLPQDIDALRAKAEAGLATLLKANSQWTLFLQQLIDRMPTRTTEGDRVNPGIVCLLGLVPQSKVEAVLGYHFRGIEGVSDAKLRSEVANPHSALTYYLAIQSVARKGQSKSVVAMLFRINCLELEALLDQRKPAALRQSVAEQELKLRRPALFPEEPRAVLPKIEGALIIVLASPREYGRNETVYRSRLLREAEFAASKERERGHHVDIEVLRGDHLSAIATVRENAARYTQALVLYGGDLAYTFVFSRLCDPPDQPAGLPGIRAYLTGEEIEKSLQGCGVPEWVPGYRNRGTPNSPVVDRIADALAMLREGRDIHSSRSRPATP